jgi:alpha-tubulin suppressor-like RCC1 family protein
MVLDNGTVVAWGNSSGGRLAVPSGLSNVVAVSAAQHSVALRKEGTVVVWGANNDSAVTTVPASVTNVVAIAAGSGSSGNVYTILL